MPGRLPESSVAGFAGGAWVSAALVVALLETELRLRVVHPHFLPLALLLVLLALCTMGALIAGLERLVRGPRRTIGLGWMALGLLPVLLVFVPCEYARRREEGRDYPRGFAFDFACAVGASLMEGQAQYLYPHRLRTPRVVMYYRLLVNPRRDAEEMERHVERLERLVGRPLRAPIHWARGPLLGRDSLSVCGLSLGTSESPERWDGESLDRHELAHAVIWQQAPFEADPPAVLMEGWAEAESGCTPKSLAIRALSLQSKGQAPTLEQLVAPNRYHLHAGAAYDEGGALVDFLIRRYGMARFLRLYNRSKPATFAASCGSILGVDLPELEQQFCRDARHWWPADEPTPAVILPVVRLPSPNARDLFLKATRQMRDRARIEAVFAGPSARPDRPSVLRPPSSMVPAPELDRLVQENGPALRTLRQGFRYPYREVPIRSFQTVLTYYGAFRSLARLLALEAQARAARGDWGGAVDSDLDAIQLGVEMQRGAPVLGMVVGLSCQETGARDATGRVDRLSPSGAAAAARRLAGILARRVLYADVLREEKWCADASLLELFRQPDWRVRLVEVLGNDAPAACVGKRAALTAYDRYMDRLIAQSRLPYRPASPPPAVPEDPVAKALVTMPTVERSRYEQVHALNAALELRLRARVQPLRRQKSAPPVGSGQPG